jgi:hypothetical protein
MGDPGSGTKVTWGTLLRIGLKVLVLFILLNVLYVVLDPIDSLANLSLYNQFIPGRERFPYGDDPERSFNLSITTLSAILASHEIAGAEKDSNEFRVLLIGDSSVWGFLQDPSETISEQLNAGNYRLSDGMMLRAYNFGYPTLSALKDLLFLQEGMGYDPDLIVWFVTLEALPSQSQLDSPVLEFNPEAVEGLSATTHLDLAIEPSSQPKWLERTIIGERRLLADLIRNQVVGLLWAATGQDQYIPPVTDTVTVDLEAEESFQGFQPDELAYTDLSWDILDAGLELAGDIPVIIINEPIYRSDGLNSDLRYNYYYPIWAYDQFRTWITEWAGEREVLFIDLWDQIPNDEFTDSSIHYSPAGARIVSDWIAKSALRLGDGE